MAASSAAFKELKDHSVVVFMYSKGMGLWASVSPMVATGLNEPKMGDFIPKAVITSPDMSEIWGQMTYPDLKEAKKYREMKKRVVAICEGESEPERNPDRVLYWSSKGGDRYYVGSFQKVDDKGKLVLKSKEGKTMKVGFHLLSTNAAQFAKRLAGQGEKSAPAVEATLDYEDWTGSNGKVIKAKFVKLVDDKVTLEMESGKNYTLPLDRLTKASQNRAKELGGE